MNLPDNSHANPGYEPPVSTPSAQAVRSLTTDGIPSLTDNYLHAIAPKHLAQLTEAQIKAFTPEQIGRLTYDQLAALRPKQLKALSGEQLQAIRPSRLEAIKPGRIAYLKPEQVAAFTPDQISALTPEQVGKMTGPQWAALGEAQLQAFGGDQLRTARLKIISGLEPERFASFTQAQLGELSFNQMGAVTGEQLNALGKKQLRAFTSEQLQGISLPTIADLATLTVSRFLPKQTAAFSLRQLNTFTPEQTNALRWNQKLKMSPEQTNILGVMNPSLVFGYTAITAGSVAFGFLPPQAREGIGAMAFGIRGTGMFFKAVRPEAFTPDKPGGRIIRVIDVATFIPNIANGAINVGDAPLINSTYQAGNLTYAGKALEELRTKKAAFPATDKAALPLYAAGSVDYTYGSWTNGGSDLSPIMPDAVSDTIGRIPGGADTVGGALFTAGSIYLGVDAFRPLSGKGPRIALAVTFGGGLLVFSALEASKWWSNYVEDASPTDDVAPVDTTPPEEPTEPPVEPQDEPGEPETPAPQLVVVAQDGLNLRGAPTTASGEVTVLHPGALVQETGERRSDDAGTEWVSVSGYGLDGEQYEGWVDASFVSPHADGSQDAEGRYNPELESQGYEWVSVETGQSIGSIARGHSVDVSDTIVLNMDHIVSPHLVYVGDRVYLPMSQTV
ncbi:SH3 domain-containing protein [Aquamicrobium sp. LC103]|uniref:SH3 domain-containing protein n=1 Tax=Aquamicrobium sp. LC103 TaxID=1120658 RepID=UPI00109C775A|nr:SH3 domain-containing protein [Aquamicrobium sp. LC103]TKT69269.1 SH3 domain-containing protein [Aquamicrobium sp. LC103]